MTQHTTLPPDHDRDFHQLTGAFDRPVAPSPAFAERLKQQIAETQHEKGAPTMHATQVARPRVTRMTTGATIPMPDQGSRIVRGLEAVAAAVLILALIGGGFFMNRSGSGPDDSRTRLAAVTGTSTPEADVTPDLVPAGTNGPASYFPDPAFDTTTPMSYSTSELGEATHSIVRSIDASGRYLVQTGTTQGSIDSEGGAFLRISDIQTGDMLWESPENYLNRIAIRNNTIYAVQVTPNQEMPTGNLVALALDIGEQRFNAPVLTRMSGGSQITPVVVGDTVFVADAIGTTYALDAETGDQRWVTEGPEVTSPSDSHPGGALVATQDAVFVATGTGTLRALDVQDGSILFETDFPTPDPFEITLYRSGNQIIARMMDTSDTQADDVHGNVVRMIPETIVSLDATTGDIEWTTPFPEIAGDIAVTPDRIYVPTRQSGTDPIDVHILNIAGGSMHNVPHLSSARTMNVTATGNTGNTLILLDSESRIQVMTVQDPTDWSVQYEGKVGSNTGEGQPPSITIADGKAYTADENGQVVVLTPQQVAEPATPEASASAWFDPGHTNAFPAGFDPETARPAEQLGDFGLDDYFGLVTGNTLVSVGIPSDANAEDFTGKPTIAGIDLVTNKVKWSMTRDLSPSLAAGNNAIFGVGLRDETPEGDQTLELFAISIETGETLWAQTVFTLPASAGLDIVSPFAKPVGAPIVIDGTVYIARDSGDVAAFNEQSGDIEWQTEGWDDERNPENVGGSLVGDDTYLYVVDGENNILKLDRASGEVLDTLALNLRPAPAFLLELHLQDDRLVLIARDSQRSSSGTLVDVLDVDSGASLWSTKLQSDIEYGYPVGSMTIANGILAIPERINEDASPEAGSTASGTQVHFYDLDTGEPVSEYGPTTSMTASVSASGNVVCIHEASSAISCADFSKANPALIGIDIGAPYNTDMPSSPVLFWHDSAIVLGHDGGPYIIRSEIAAPEITTPVASPTITPTVVTDPGHTNAYPAGFDPETAQPAKPLGDVDFMSDSGFIVDNTLILFGHPDEEPRDDIGYLYNTIGVDLTTGKQIWNKNRGIINPPAMGGSAFYTIEMDSAPNNEYNFMLVSVSPESGLPNWGHTFATRTQDQLDSISPNSPLLLGTPIEIGGVVYLATGTGDVTAWDADSGDEIWRTSNADASDNGTEIGGSLVGNDEYLFVVDGKNNILKRDRTTGTVIETFQTTRPVSEDLLKLILSDDTIIVLSQDRIYIDPVDTSVDALSTSGEPLWSINVGQRTGSPAITDGIIGIPQSTSTNATPTTSSTTVVFYDLATGDTLGNVTAPYWSGASVSAAGPVICVHGTSAQLSCFDTTDPDSDPQTIDIGAVYVAEGPPSPVLFWNDSAIVLGHDGGPYIIRSGEATAKASATPAASPVTTSESSAVQQDARGALLTNDPGHTSAYPAGYDPAQTGAPAKLEALRVSPGTSVIAGDTLIVSGRDEETWRKDRAIVMATQAIDLGTGKELWSTDTGLFGTLVVDDWNIYGYQSDPDYQRSSNNLVSLSLETGALNWKIQPLTPAPNGTLTSTADLLMIGTHLYVPFPNGSVTAYSQLGKVEWSHETGLDTQGFFENWHPVAGDENTLYVAGQDGEVTKVDRLTGEVLDTFTTGIEPKRADAMDLHVRAGTLVAVVHPPDGPERAREMIVVMSAESGEVRWTQEADYVTGNLLLTDSMVGISQHVLNGDVTGQKIAFHDIDSGRMIVETTVASSAYPNLSASGEVVCISTSEVRCGPVDDLRRVITGVAFPNAMAANPPIMFWKNQLVIVNTETGVYVTAPSDPTGSAFHPDYQSTGDLTVNLRWGPGVRYDVAATVSPDEPLQSLGASEPTRHPDEDMLAEGQSWLKVRTRNGDESWVREVDVTGYIP